MAKNEELFTKRNTELFGKEYVKILTLELKRAGKDASGKLIKSIDFRIKEDARAINTLIESDDYMEFVDKGRRAGSYPPINAIAKWASLKGISKDAVFPIARKIYKFGIKPTNILDKVAKKIETSNVLTRQMENALAENIADKILEDLKQK